MAGRAQEVAYSCATNPGLVNQGLAQVHGCDLGIELFGPLILSVQSRPPPPRGHSHTAQTAWTQGRCEQRHLMVLGERLSVVSSHYLMMPNTRSISFRYHISSWRLLRADANLGEATLTWVPGQCP